MLARLYITLFAVCVSFHCQTQHHQIGVLYGHGGPNYLNVDYSYEVKLVQVQYTYAFKPMKQWGCEVYAIPQFNFTEFRERNHHTYTQKGYEYGINFGVLMRRYFYNDIASYYVGLSLGPHYVSGTPNRQVPGFIFSDNLFVGISAKILDNVYIDVRPGFRHISNANLEKPNKGVNSLIINGGIFFQFGD